MLKVRWWRRQVDVAEALLKHKRVFVKASHSVGKSFLAGGLVNWFFDCFNPGLCITTAPNASQVRDILWKEVRIQCPEDLRDALLPKAPRMETSPDHFAVGYTARSDSGFQGRHEEFVFIVFDECVGVEAAFWDAAEGMMVGPACYWLALCNPTDTSSRAFEESKNTGTWHVIEISALDHPNIAADLRGVRPPFPKAVRLEWIEGRLNEWCDPIPAGDRRAGDVEFPPASGQWYRPGSLFESRVLGRWPSQGSTSVWSDAAWQAAQVPRGFDAAAPLVLSCDVARFGDDFTTIMGRRGPCIVHHETHNGWSTVQTAGRLKQLAREFGGGGNGMDGSYGFDPRRVAIYVDDDGVGGGVVDQGDDYQFVPISGASRAIEATGYPNRRSELWFVTVGRALSKDGRAGSGFGDMGLDLSRLSAQSRNLLRGQLMTPTWKLDAQGRRVVEPKSETKRRIGRSPDDADALNLLFAQGAELRSDPAAHRRFWEGNGIDGKLGNGWDE